MKSKLLRSADNHNVMAAIHPYPKPMKDDREKKKKISLPRRKILEAQLEAIVKAIVFWRDGGQCILRDIDGVMCRGKMDWGHFIPRNKSKFLKYDLATFVQCDGHNFIHDSKKAGGDPIFGLWISKTFGINALAALHQTQREHTKGKIQTIPELEEMLAHYDQLYQDRIYADLSLGGLIRGGYYGEIIKSVVE